MHKSPSLLAKTSLQPSPPVRSKALARCQATTKAKKPCPFKAAPGSRYCPQHNPDESPDERSERLSKLGQRGGQAKKENKVKASLTVSLATGACIREALERALADVQASGADPLARANATARLCSVAKDLLVGLDLEIQVEELRQLVAERLGRDGDDAQ